MYHQQRLELNNKSANASRAGRNSMYASDYVTCVVDKKAAIQTSLSAAKVKAYKQQFIREFPQVTHIIETYKAVDQGEEGACSLVGFINLAQLSGISISSARKNWKRYWNNRVSMEDIGEMLDTFSRKLNFGTFQYIPINGTYEGYYNKTHWKPSLCQQHFGITSAEYNKSPFVFENGYLIETLLASGPVEINALEHSRTAIAYNDEHLLFADNWSPSAYLESRQKANALGKIKDNEGKLFPNSKPIEIFAASFSRVNKWFIYSMMRDIVYFPNSRGDAMAVPKKKEVVPAPQKRPKPSVKRSKSRTSRRLTVDSPVRTSRNKTPAAPKKKPEKAPTRRTKAKASRRIIPNDFTKMSRQELRAAAKDGKLREYGVNGNSSSDAIRRALRKKNNKNN